MLSAMDSVRPTTLERGTIVERRSIIQRSAIIQRSNLRRVLIVGWAGMCLLLQASLGHSADSPYLIKKKDFKKQITNVALTPLNAPQMLILTPEMRTLIEAEATRRLGKTRIKNIGIGPYSEVVDLFTKQVGGLLNDAGELDSRRETLMLDHARREMRHRYPVDGFAEISLRVVNADFADDRAEWDGIKQKVKKSGDGFALFGGGKDYRGSIAAVSFQLAIYDRSEKLMFSQRGGIEVLQERKGSNLVLLPLDGLLTNEKRLKKAVQLAFKSL